MRRFTARHALPGVLLALAGCLGPASTIVQTPAVTEANTQASLRVDTVGRKVVAANPGLPCQPVFRTHGAKTIELFHAVNGEHTVITITEGLVDRCSTDAQLAAVLCHELARIASEKDMLARAGARPEGYRPPADVPVGNDGSIDGSTADQTRLAELAKDTRLWQQRHGGISDPAALTRTYLSASGYSPDLADTVPELTKGMATRNTLEKLMTGGGLRW